MNNLEKRLVRAKPEPSRTLSSDFTQKVLVKTRVKKQTYSLSGILSSIQERVSMYKLNKPATMFASLAIAALLSGTAYAAICWINPNAKLDTGSITTLANGNKRFWVHADSCQGQSIDFPIDSYYEIKAGSSLTPDDIRNHVQAECEADLLAELFPEAASSYKNFASFKAGDKQYYTPWSQIKAIDGANISFSSHLNGKTYPDTFLPTDNDLQVYYKGQAISRTDLKVGDWITLISYTTELKEPFETESLSSENIEKLMKDGFPVGARVHGIIKLSHNPMSSTVYPQLGQDWTRLEKDKNTPDGWKQIVPLN